jgi:hypothetical protein
MIVITGVTVKLAISIVPSVTPSNVYALIYNPVINNLSKKNTPTKSNAVIKKCVGKFAFTVKNFNKGPDIIMVSVRISKVIIKYNPTLGNVIPL